MVQGSNLKTGRHGEMLARKYLEDKGYTIIDQNFRNKYAEIDLIVSKDDMLVFVEVRTKTGEQFGTPEESIDRRKINKLKKNAKAYVWYKKYSQMYRIDAICIVLDECGEIMRISHYECIS
ncbi:MAG: YraN family protein [PVC group bacterium]|nr:YraN family protein [PVC group bacterium]